MEISFINHIIVKLREVFGILLKKCMELPMEKHLKVAEDLGIIGQRGNKYIAVLKI